MFYHTRTWHKVFLRNFSVDTALNGMSAWCDLFLSEAKRLAHGNTDLFNNQVCACNHFCDTVLDLNTGIHFHEVVSSALVKNELDRSGICVTNSFCGKNGIVVHGSAGIGCDSRRRRFFNQLLVVALYRTVTFAESHYISMSVSHDLDLYMAWVFNIFFNVHGVIAKCVGRLSLSHVEIEFKIIFRAGDTHALSTSAGGGFDHNRITDFVCKLFAGLYVIDWIFRTWNDRNSGLHHCLSGVGFISHAVDNICTWSDKCNAVFFAQTYKV